MELLLHRHYIMVCTEPVRGNSETSCGVTPLWRVISMLITAALLSVSPIYGQYETPAWQTQVRKYAEARDWDSAMRLVDEQISLAPQNIDVRAWRARVLTWSQRLPEAETEYLEILKAAPNDPDNWMGLTSVYMREGKIQEAQRAIDTAAELDPKRADLHAARARVLRSAGERDKARLEFQEAMNLDPSSVEARAGIISLLGEPKHEFRIGQDNDLFNFSGANHIEWASLTSQWSPHWVSSVSGDFYQRGLADAGKFVGSVTRRQPKWGAAAVGGGVGHDNALIPKREVFFDLDHGWKTGEANFVSAIEFIYGQHWYWFRASRILALNATAIIYLPREWTLLLGETGARSVFSGTGPEWRPSVITRLAFPLARCGEKHISGNVFFAAGTENFAQVDQIGRFASQTYGTGLRIQIAARQDVTGHAAYQKRTQNRTDTSFGLSYGIHF